MDSGCGEFSLSRLDDIARDAMLVAKRERDGGPDCASDFGRRARHWERLSDAAYALASLGRQDQRQQSGAPDAHTEDGEGRSAAKGADA